MKPVKLFVVLLVVFYACLLLIDVLKATVFVVNYHSFFTWFKTFFLVGGGILIMYFTVEKSFFKTFLVIYLSTWFAYFLLKKFLPYTGVEQLKEQLGGNKVMAFFLNVTQLYTPLPFILFWLIHRVFKVQEK